MLLELVTTAAQQAHAAGSELGANPLAAEGRGLYSRGARSPEPQQALGAARRRGDSVIARDNEPGFNILF